MLLTLLLLQTSIAPIRLTADSARLSGPRLARERSGYSGSGYITDLTRDKDFVSWQFQARSGIYDVFVRYASGGDKGIAMAVDGFGLSGMLLNSGGQWKELPVGKIELANGANELVLKKGWGYYDLDSIELKPSGPVPALKPVEATPVTPHASIEARRLLKFLTTRYGKQTLTGQTNIEDAAAIERKIGKLPAIVATDLMDYSPSRLPFETTPLHDTEEAIEAAKNHEIIAIQWHWNAPSHLLNKVYKDAQGNEINGSWNKGFYTNASTFDVAQAMSQPDSEEHKLIDRDIDAIAVQLKKYQAAHVPVLFRPLHEAEGGWFWWGAKGPGPCLQLYHYLYHRLVDFHHIDNLLWVWNSANPDWYPGDDEVDIMAVDAYPEDPRDSLAGTWEPLLKRFDGKKMLALAEIGGVPDVERNFKLGVRWVYFVSWGGEFAGANLSTHDLKKRYLNPKTVVLGSWH